MAVSPIVTPLVRFGYPNLFTPRAGAQGQEPKFSVALIFIDQAPFMPKDANGEMICPSNMKPEDFEQFKADYAKDPTLLIRVRRHLLAVCEEKWGADHSKWKALGRVNFASHVGEERAWPIRDGNNKNKPGFNDVLYANCSANKDRQPGVVARDGRTHITDPRQVFGGLIGRALINAWCWGDKNPAGGHGVSLGLQHVQIIADDGTRYGGGAALTDDTFGAYEGPADDPSAYDAPNAGSSGGVQATDEAF